MQIIGLLSAIKAQWLNIQVIGGNLHVEPLSRITENIRAQIKEQKTALIDFLEVWEERAAIMEFDAGLSRLEAEQKAFENLEAGIG